MIDDNNLPIFPAIYSYCKNPSVFLYFIYRSQSELVRGQFLPDCLVTCNSPLAAMIKVLACFNFCSAIPNWVSPYEGSLCPIVWSPAIHRWQQ